MLNTQRVATLRISNLAIELAITTSAGRAEFSPQSVSAAGQLALANVFNLNGTLRLSRDSGGEAASSVTLSFVPSMETSSVSLPLPIPTPNGQTASLQVGLGAITIGRTASDDPSASQAASGRFEGSVTLAISGLPTAIQSLLPAQSSARLHYLGRSLLRQGAFGDVAMIILWPGGGQRQVK